MELKKEKKDPLANFRCTLRPPEKDSTDGMILDEVTKLRHKGYQRINESRKKYEETKFLKKIIEIEESKGKPIESNRSYFKTLRFSTQIPSFNDENSPTYNNGQQIVNNLVNDTIKRGKQAYNINDDNDYEDEPKPDIFKVELKKRKIKNPADNNFRDSNILDYFESKSIEKAKKSGNSLRNSDNLSGGNSVYSKTSNTTTKSTHKKLADSVIAFVKLIFNMFDPDGKGRIKKSDFVNGLYYDEINMSDFNFKSDQEFIDKFNKFPVRQEGIIRQNEFLRFFLSRIDFNKKVEKKRDIEYEEEMERQMRRSNSNEGGMKSFDSRTGKMTYDDTNKYIDNGYPEGKDIDAPDTHKKYNYENLGEGETFYLKNGKLDRENEHHFRNSSNKENMNRGEKNYNQNKNSNSNKNNKNSPRQNRNSKNSPNNKKKENMTKTHMHDASYHSGQSEEDLTASNAYNNKHLYRNEKGNRKVKVNEDEDYYNSYRGNK